jgi:hypothetical protein
MTDARPSRSAELPPVWEQVVDELERAARTGVDYRPPEGLPPLPAHLEHRAREVMASLEQRHRELLAERDAVGAELAALHRCGRGAHRRGSAPTGPAAAPRIYDSRI